MLLVDSHCHLDAGEFDHDREAVIRRARDAGVQLQVVPATHAEAWPGLREVCSSAAGLCPAYGMHPVFLDQHKPGDLERLREWLQCGRPVAVGECGLDHYIEELDRDQQLRWFEAQLRLAREFDLPVIVHARRAVDAVIAAIRRIGGTGTGGALRGVVHSFSGSEEQARQLWKLGFLLGLGGPVTYERARRLRRLAASMPLEYLLLETDAPDQPDCASRGQRNEPAKLLAVLDAIAALRDEDPEAIAAATSANACRLFGLSMP
jgi:TatD DNase family protein